jgi:hypothetical protein
MATNRTINGVTYSIPDQGDNYLWGTGVSGWVGAVTNGGLFKSAGLFQLTAELDFGTAYGLKALYFKSRAATVANSGALQLGNTDVVAWVGSTGDVGLGIGANNAVKSNTGFDAGALKVANVASPTVSSDAATKGYVDSATANLTSVGNTQILYSANGIFSGNAALTFTSNNSLNLTGTLTVTGSSVANAHRDTFSNVGVLTGATNINCASAVYQDVMLAGNPTITFQNAGPAGQATVFTVYVRQSGNGSNTITWANTVRWSDNAKPVLSTTANTADMFTFVTFDGGTIWLGTQVMGNVPLANVWF